MPYPQDEFFRSIDPVWARQSSIPSPSRPSPFRPSPLRMSPSPERPTPRTTRWVHGRLDSPRAHSRTVTCSCARPERARRVSKCFCRKLALERLLERASGQPTNRRKPIRAIASKSASSRTLRPAIYCTQSHSYLRRRRWSIRTSRAHTQSSQGKNQIRRRHGEAPESSPVSSSAAEMWRRRRGRGPGRWARGCVPMGSPLGQVRAWMVR